MSNESETHPQDDINSTREGSSSTPSVGLDNSDNEGEVYTNLGSIFKLESNDMSSLKLAHKILSRGIKSANPLPGFMQGQITGRKLQFVSDKLQVMETKMRELSSGNKEIFLVGAEYVKAFQDEIYRLNNKINSLEIELESKEAGQTQNELASESSNSGTEAEESDSDAGPIGTDLDEDGHGRSPPQKSTSYGHRSGQNCRDTKSVQNQSTSSSHQSTRKTVGEDSELDELRREVAEARKSMSEKDDVTISDDERTLSKLNSPNHAEFVDEEEAIGNGDVEISTSDGHSNDRGRDLDNAFKLDNKAQPSLKLAYKIMSWLSRNEQPLHGFTSSRDLTAEELHLVWVQLTDMEIKWRELASRNKEVFLVGGKRIEADRDKIEYLSKLRKYNGILIDELEMNLEAKDGEIEKLKEGFERQHQQHVESVGLAQIEDGEGIVHRGQGERNLENPLSDPPDGVSVEVEEDGPSFESTDQRIASVDLRIILTQEQYAVFTGVVESGNWDQVVIPIHVGEQKPIHVALGVQGKTAEYIENGTDFNRSSGEISLEENTRVGEEDDDGGMIEDNGEHFILGQNNTQHFESSLSAAGGGEARNSENPVSVPNDETSVEDEDADADLDRAQDAHSSPANLELANRPHRQYWGGKSDTNPSTSSNHKSSRKIINTLKSDKRKELRSKLATATITSNSKSIRKGKAVPNNSQRKSRKTSSNAPRANQVRSNQTCNPSPAECLSCRKRLAYMKKLYQDNMKIHGSRSQQTHDRVM